MESHNDDGYTDTEVDHEMAEVTAALLEDDVANQRFLNAQKIVPESDHQQHPSGHAGPFHQVGQQP
jgi:hypothetical protein